MEKSTRNSLIITFIGVVIIVVAVLIIALVNNHKSSSSAIVASDKSQIKSDWQTFFAAKTTMAERENLLQNSKNFESELQTEFMAIGSQEPSATVNSVKLTNNNTSANVNYTVSLGGHPVLVGQEGTAVVVNGEWKVSDATLCGLLKMAGISPASCLKL